MGTCIQMAATSTGGSEAALAQIDVPKDGNLVGVEWSTRTDFDTDNDFQDWSVSFGSTIITANDSRQVIANMSTGTFTTSATGMVVGRGWGFTKLPDIMVSGGERLFLHSNASAGAVGLAKVMLHFDFDLDLPKARRR